MDERKFFNVKIRLCREMNNLKDALQMFAALASSMNMDEIDEISMDEGELVKALCKKVSADIDELFNFGK